MRLGYRRKRFTDIKVIKYNKKIKQRVNYFYDMYL